ncbi:MAG: hypothetical protein ACO1RA_05005 [Planctomycetaceae bacterium]
MADETASPATNHPLWIDQRLDQIEGALLGVLPRQERMSLLAGIESRLVKLAAENPELEKSVTQKLEAPELASSQAVAKSTGTSANPTTTARRSRMAFTSGILGIVVLVLMFFSPIIYTLAAFASELSESMGEVGAVILLVGLVLLLAFGGFAAVVMGIVSLVKISRSQKKLVGTGWAITGLCTGPMPMFAGAFGMLIFLPLVAEVSGDFSGMSVSYESSPTAVVSKAGDCTSEACASPVAVSPSTLTLPPALPSVSSAAYPPACLPPSSTPAPTADFVAPATAEGPVPLLTVPVGSETKAVPGEPATIAPELNAPAATPPVLGEVEAS